MGLLGSTVDYITDGVGGAIDTVENVVTGGDATENPQQYEDPETLDGTVQAVEDNVNDAVEQTVSWTSRSLDGGTDGTFTMLQTGVDTFQGFLMTVAGAFNFMKNLVGFVPFPSVKDFLQTLLGGMAGLFEGFAGLVGVIEGILGFAKSASGLEGAGFLIGMLLMFLGGYLIISGIISGEILLFTSFVEDVFDGIMGFWIGLTLVIWSNQNFIGGLMMFATGLILLFYALEAGEDSYIPFGVPTLLLGIPMLFSAVGLRFTGTFTMSVIGFLITVYLLELLTSDAGATAYNRFSDSLVGGGGK